MAQMPVVRVPVQLDGASAQDLVRLVIMQMGDDPDRPGLRETPARVVKAWDEMFSGYRTDPRGLLKVFEEEHSDEMIVLRDIPFTSFCEHHLLPFTGVAHVAYLPSGGRVVGLSKLARVVDVFAKRLQIQERLTKQISHTLMECVLPRGVGCMIEATHHCMCARGVGKAGATMVTSSLTGVFKEPGVKAEFLALVRAGS